MTYLVLARKYRPHNFSEVVGQSHILKALTHAITHNRLHHAYLLTGTRGVGKTSLARILAKCFNCETGLTATPCGVCLNCQEIDQNRSVDVMEIDAASRTKVEDTRELLENIQYAPQHSRFRIYIIDEVHMLSNHSFNALLKTLEEPPPHVKFLLATTDPQKLPVTILSRCLQFHLKNISAEQISAQLEVILTKENITYEKSGCDLIANQAQGSMRDALSLLDQCIAYGEGSLLENNINILLGGISEEKVIELLDKIHTRETQKIIDLINQFEENNSDFFVLLDKLLIYLQKLAVLQFTQSQSHINNLFTPEEIQLYYQIALLGKRDLPLAPDPKSGFIMIAIRMAAFRPISQKEKSNVALDCRAPQIPQQVRDRELAMRPTFETPTFDWTSLINQLNLTGLSKILAQNCVLLNIDSENQTIELILDTAQAALLTDTAKERLKQALAEYYQKPYQLFISISKTPVETPSQQKNRESTEKNQAREATLLADKTVQSLIQTFSATVIADSITDIDSEE